MSPMMRLPLPTASEVTTEGGIEMRLLLLLLLLWQWPLPTNGALNILQLWASGGRKHEPILKKMVHSSMLGLERQSHD